MWHVETDYFALILFVIMLIKNRTLKKEHNFQENVFYYVLIASIANVPLRSITLNFPVFVDSGDTSEILWDKGNTVETVCLLSHMI